MFEEKREKAFIWICMNAEFKRDNHPKEKVENHRADSMPLMELKNSRYVDRIAVGKFSNSGHQARVLQPWLALSCVIGSLLGTVSLSSHSSSGGNEGGSDRSESPFGRTVTSPQEPKLWSDRGDTMFVIFAGGLGKDRGCAYSWNVS